MKSPIGPGDIGQPTKSSTLGVADRTTATLTRTPSDLRPGKSAESGLNLADPEKINYFNALQLAKFSQDSYTQFNHAVGHTQYMHKEFPDHQVLAFAGSYELKDWGHDANFSRTSYKDMGHVHRGFASAYEEIIGTLDCVDKDKPLILTGHSLGGATATIAALDLKRRGYNVHSMYTFGSPKVGNAAFKEAYDKEGIPTFRFVNSFDVVSRMPKMGYKHVGEPVFISSKGERLERQESALTLWPWEVPAKRLTSHEMNNYVGNLAKFIG